LAGGTGISSHPRVLVVDASKQSVEDAVEEVLGLLEGGVIIEARNAPSDYWAKLLGRIRRRGGNWLMARYIDADRDARLLGGLELRILEEALKTYLISTGEAHRPVSKQSLSKPVSRRDLLRRPLTALAEYTSIPLVDSDSCASRYAYCGECAGSCPYNALSGKPPTIDPDRCLECGLCANSCPMGLIRSPRASLNGYYSFLRSLSAQEGSASILALCPATRAKLYEDLDSDPEWKPIMPLIPFEVDCYPSLTYYHIALSSLTGLPLSYYCPDEVRAKCSKREAMDTYLEILGEVEEVLGVKTLVVRSLSELKPAPRPPSLIPPPTLRGLRESLALLAPRRGEWVELKHLPLYKLNVSDKCTLCGVCVQACPEEALIMKNTGEKYILRFNHTRCTGCRACVEKCPENAITIERAGNPGLLASGGWVDVAQSDIARCIICGAPIGPEKAIRRVEEILRSRGASEEVIRSVRICQKCKTRMQLEKLLGGGGAQGK